MVVSIVIVNWKVKDLLRRCLFSVYAQTKGVSFEVLVVDNDSRDGSVEIIAGEFPQATIIASNRNLGFAAGNNLAIARARGEFVLLLNPDTELREDAVSKMVAWMRMSSRAAIMGPRLANHDGSLQASVRRLPTPYSQALIMLKLHHALPRLKALRRYFAADFDYDKAAAVDQVMGAAFLVRRSAFERLGLLDERFFIWFEEVDYCKRAKDAGLQVWYAPVATVVHHGGESFGQVFGPKKQGMFNDSLRKYFLKHSGVGSWLALTALDPVSKALAWGVAMGAVPGKGTVPSGSRIAGFAPVYRLTLLLIVMFELVSLAAFLLPAAVSSAVWMIIIALVAALAVMRFDLAMLVLLAELFIGSQGGYLVSLGREQGLDLSLRHGLFLVIVAVWSAELVAATIAGGARRREAWDPLIRMQRRGALLPYVMLLLVIVFGVIRGALLGNGYGTIFFDVDRYLYYALFPALVAALAKPEMRLRLAAVLCAAITGSVGEALVTLFFFSHRVFVVASNMYVWIRDTRVGEITVMAADFYRIFFQSQIFILVTVFAAALIFAYSADLKTKRARCAAAFVGWSMVSMVLSLSRSFWFGGVAAAAALLAILAWGKAELKVWRRLGALAVGSVVAAVALIAAVYYFPYPNKSGQLSLTSLLGDRALSLGDPAANSRWALLPKLTEAAMRRPIFGSGYGTTVTYTTSDPRLLASNKTGEYTTYAFEWGYHDLWLKIGLVGLAIYGWFIACLLRPLARTIMASRKEYRAADLAALSGRKPTALFAAGLFVGVVALLATNVFSPYLNHPLGIGILMLIGALGAHGVFYEGTKPV